eukprot:TRINITY_DN6156_c0_g1_i1.p1 TRINITY_DN6156_c0_g1~~TRINITY_DN6156_c0_g1_i1.p1  ORF type:complete len:261 (-),score=17.60 TRINITY_DN6156_c0_g1_i1:221-1003(-)
MTTSMAISTWESGRTTRRLGKAGCSTIMGMNIMAIGCTTKNTEKVLPLVIVGILSYSNGDSYDGDWRHDQKLGNGKQASSPRHSILQQRGQVHGRLERREERRQRYVSTQSVGTLYCANGEQYEGDWRDDKKHGHGIYTYQDGGKYDGQWKSDVREGKGSGWREGVGVLTEANKNLYNGWFKEDKRNERGVQYYSNGDKYNGDWVDDKRDGQGIAQKSLGTLYYANGGRYNGSWKDDMRDGFGRFFQHYRHSSLSKRCQV